MSPTTHQPAGQGSSTAPHFMRSSVISFILLAVVLTCLPMTERFSVPVQIRAGALADFAAEFPIGMQALVSSCRFMPLPSLAALPFLPFLPPSAYGLAHLYGTALVMALNVLSLVGLLRRLRMSPIPAFVGALFLQVAAVCLLAPQGYVDLLPCLALLATAVYLDIQPAAVRRALSGVFYGLALLTHLAGIAAAGVRVVAMLGAWAFRHRDAERNAVDLTRLGSVVYCAAVYCFLNWMIMNDPWYPVRHLRLNQPAFTTTHCLRSLERELDGPLADFVPVASGHWTYLIRPLLEKRQGRRFVDFHPDKLLLDDTTSAVLIVPRPGNPLLALADGTAPEGALLLSETPEWRFCLIPSRDASLFSPLPNSPTP